MTRPVHYHASGTGSLAFACYYKECRAWLGSELPRTEIYGPTKHSVPAPYRSTDLRKVTCPECWIEIRKMVRAFEGKWGSDERKRA